MDDNVEQDDLINKAQVDLLFKPAMEQPSFAMDGLPSIDIKLHSRRQGSYYQKNAIPESMEGCIQTQESGQMGDDETAQIKNSVFGNTENLNKMELGIKTDNKSIDTQESKNIAYLVTEETTKDGNDHEIKTEKEVNDEVERSKIGSESGCVLHTQQDDDRHGYEQEEGNQIQVSNIQQDENRDSEDAKENEHFGTTCDDKVLTIHRKMNVPSKKSDHNISKSTSIQKYIKDDKNDVRNLKDVKNTVQIVNDSAISKPIERDVPSKEPEHDISECRSAQKAFKTIAVNVHSWITMWRRLSFYLAITALLMECGRSYVQSFATDPINEIPEYAKGEEPQSLVDQLRMSNKPFQHDNAKNNTCQLPDNVKDKLERKRDYEYRHCVYCHNEEEVRKSSSLQRGQHISLLRLKILGYEIYRHHAIVLNVTQLSDTKAELTLISYAQYGKMPVLITTEVCDLTFDDISIINCRYPIYSPNEIAQRAESEKEKSKGYNIYFNNCEHFATRSACGISKSIQAERFLILLRGLLMYWFILQVTVCWLPVYPKNNLSKVLIFYLFKIVIIFSEIINFGPSVLLIYYNYVFWFGGF